MIDKGIYAAPLGMSGGSPHDMPIEIEIEDPEAVTIGIDGLEIEIEPGKETAEDFDANLAEFMDDGELQAIGNTLLQDIDNDLTSRRD